MPLPTYKAAIGYLHRENLIPEFQRSLERLRLIDDDPNGPHVFEHREMRKQGSYRVDYERNRTMEGLLRYDRKVTKILLLDDDHSFTPDQAYQLLGLCTERTPIVSGLYFAVHSNDIKRPYLRPLLLKQDPDLNGYQTMYEYPRNAMLAVDQIGLGFCAIWRQTLEDWREKHGPTWFEYGVRPNGKRTLEDEAFCRKMRYELKVPIFVHTGIVVPHWKRWGFGQRDYDAQIAVYEKEEAQKHAVAIS